MIRPTRTHAVRALLLACALASVAAAAAPAGADAFLTVKPAKVAAGKPLAFKGTCPAGSRLAALRAYSTQPSGLDRFDFPPIEAATNAQGAFKGSVVVPANAPAGTYRLESFCVSGDIAMPRGSAGFTVTVPPRRPGR